MGYEIKNTPPKWDAAGTEPSTDLQANGFVAGYKPPASYFNFLFNRYTACISEMQNILKEMDISVDITEDDLPIVPIAKGGTGATNAVGALANLGALPKNGSVPMSGNLTIERAGYTRITQNNTATGATAIQAITDNGKSGYWNFQDADGVEHEVRMNGGNLEYKKDGQYHKLFGQHNTSDLTNVIKNLLTGGEISMVKSVQRGITQVPYAANVTISAVNPKKTFVNVQTAVPNTAELNQALNASGPATGGALTNSTTLRLYSSDSSYFAVWEVIEFY